MTYLPKTIKEVVQEMNTKYFLPHIQRELVWKPNQIRKLFDSLMRGYPISTFLFWKITNNKDEITKLEFIKRFNKNSKNEINKDIERDEYWLVLDGQQRLQSFFIALKGEYNDKASFFNVLSKKPIEEDEGEDESEIIYETNFFKRNETSFFKTERDKKNEKESKKLWVKLKDFCLLDEEKIYEFIQEVKEKHKKDITLEESNLLDKNVKVMYDKISISPNIYYFLEEKEDYDRVLDIFIRTNSGGTKLSKSDLLFSVIKLKWKKVNAFSEFNNLIKRVNEKGEDFEFDNDFILKTCLVLINKDIKYRVENFNEKNVAEIEENWKKIKESIEITIDFIVNSLGIKSKKQLTSKNSIIPIINYTFVNDIKTYHSDKDYVVNSTRLIKNWVFSVLLTNLFSSQTDELLKRFRNVINQNKGIFPLKKLNSSLPPGKSLEINEENFDKIKYNDGIDFLVLAMLYPNFDLSPISDKNKPHKDHIFSESELEKRGYSADIINNIGNLQFLTAVENESKNKMPFEEWIKSLNKEFIEKSKIPKNKDLWKIENSEKFIEERRKLMFRELTYLLKSFILIKKA